MAIKTQQELYEEYIQELQTLKPSLTDTSEGSIIDVLAGVSSMAVNEVLKLVIDEIRKTFIDTANGPEITGGPDEIQTLVVDHFGPSFARPQAVKATGTVKFSRPNDDAGNVTIPAGTIVKTAASATGRSVRFETVTEVVLTGTEINASVRAIVAGPSGNVQAGTVTQIEGSLTDSSVVVSNAASFTGGQEAQNDAQYRETIRNLINSLRGGTLSAIEARALTVGGVEGVKLVEFQQFVKEWDIAGEEAVGDYFAIPRSFLYIADTNGTASNALISDVQEAIMAVRATGVRVEVLGASPITQDWTINITLDPLGPNYAVLQSDTTMIKDVMRKYLQDLPIGTGFSRNDAKAFLLMMFPSDLTDLTIVTPTGDVAVSENHKIIPGTIEVV